MPRHSELKWWAKRATSPPLEAPTVVDQEKEDDDDKEDDPLPLDDEDEDVQLVEQFFDNDMLLRIETELLTR